MNKLIIVMLCLCIGFTACEDDGILPSPVPISLDFSSLEVGQKAAYQRYTSDCEGVHRDFQFTGDILIVEVIEENGQLMLQESFTPESPMYQDNPTPFKQPITGYQIQKCNKKAYGWLWKSGV